MKENEIAGLGNHNTSLFGEFDTRTGRRWNPDPKPTTSVSNYATFDNNPIWKSDPAGDDSNWPKWLMALRKTLGYEDGVVHDRNYNMGDGWLFDGPVAQQNRNTRNEINDYKRMVLIPEAPEVGEFGEMIQIGKVTEADLRFGKSVHDPKNIGIGKKLQEVESIGFNTGSKASETSMPYAKSRPSFRKGVVDKVWENASNNKAAVTDPKTGKTLSWDKSKPRNGQWDMGHKPGKEYKNMHDEYMNGKMSKDEFLNEHNNPDNYRPEDPSSNRNNK